MDTEIETVCLIPLREGDTGGVLPLLIAKGWPFSAIMCNNIIPSF